MKVTIKPGEITVEAEHARDAVEVLNSLAARVLDIYTTKPEALAEHVAEKREKTKAVHLRSVTGPEVDRPTVPVAVPVAAAPVAEPPRDATENIGLHTALKRARDAASPLPPVPPEVPGARSAAEVLLEAEQHTETFGQMQDPEPTLLAETPRVSEPGVAEPPAPVAATVTADAEAIAALQGATSLRPIFNHFIEKGITDADGLLAACVRIKDGVPYLATMVNFQKRCRTAIAVILEKDTAQAFS